jgi:hypothetical protein
MNSWLEDEAENTSLRLYWGHSQESFHPRQCPSQWTVQLLHVEDIVSVLLESGLAQFSAFTHRRQQKWQSPRAQMSVGLMALPSPPWMAALTSLPKEASAAHRMRAMYRTNVPAQLQT